MSLTGMIAVSAKIEMWQKGLHKYLSEDAKCLESSKPFNLETLRIC